jgi:hypothetical protein
MEVISRQHPMGSPSLFFVCVLKIDIISGLFVPVSTLDIAQIIILSGCHYYNLSRIILICNHIKA